MRRPKGTGSIFQRSDGVWLAQVDVTDTRGQRKRKTFSSRDRDVAEARLDAWLTTHPPRALMSIAESQLRRKEIREHTEAQWWAKVRATKECPYCGVRLTVWNLSKDHMTPISRGGSDHIDNVTPCCKHCNHVKFTMTADEFSAWRQSA